MRILFCCEFYAPSVGGVQEVMKQVAEHLVLRGHDVSVATRMLPSRSFNKLNGVEIVEFNISGNLAYGLAGEVDAYRRFVVSQDFDVIMIKAAQQCTFDALWPVLNRIDASKVLIPCGFSGLFNPAFSDYFKQLPDILRQFDHLIFYASDYRDINFVTKHGIKNFSIIPNGASEVEFSLPPDPLFRKRYNIGENDFLFLTVGSFTGEKGHFEVVSAFKKMKLKGPGTLILNGNIPPFLSEVRQEIRQSRETEQKEPFSSRFLRALRKGTIFHWPFRMLQRLLITSLKAAGIFRKRAYITIAEDINKNYTNKKVLITNLPRPELVQAFMAADLFVFASNIEYSPLVLYEAAAAGTPFLSVPVGNAEEIACWTGAGQICPAKQDKKGHTMVKPAELAKHMSRLAKEKDDLLKMGAAGRENWSKRFTWEIITAEYENIFKSSLDKRTAGK